MKSIMQRDKKCWVCGRTDGLEKHHCIHGTANRKLSERYGLTVWLCSWHHRGPEGVHFDAALDLALKRDAQKAFESKYGNRFLAVFGRNYL